MLQSSLFYRRQEVMLTELSRTHLLLFKMMENFQARLKAQHGHKEADEHLISINFCLSGIIVYGRSGSNTICESLVRLLPSSRTITDRTLAARTAAPGIRYFGLKFSKKSRQFSEKSSSPKSFSWNCFFLSYCSAFAHYVLSYYNVQLSICYD